ncbi:unnamed protein product [Ceratitis capitata]|uniref:(Mediterranean fruit fly) hypothetical protein n=3 Tax=Ceratitis capitata TaxID=7213 RepID=A0A811ULU5_CERCA|nr:unnamed protein product [Ceratitis capitata]
MHHQTSTLSLAVALTYLCCSLQIAQPLATTGYNDDYDAPQQQHAAAHTFGHTADVGVPENLLQQHHVRHRTSHHMRKSAHHGRHNQQPHVELAGGPGVSESAAEILASSRAAALVGSDEATESLNFIHASNLHKQQQHKSTKFGAQYGSVERLHLQHQKLSGVELELEPNSIRTHLHHKHHAQKSRTTTTTATTTTSTMSTTNNNALPIVSEARTTAQTMELVKPTSHPTKSAERNTIKLDEVNKGTQNYYQQPIIHLQQQQQQQAREQVHYKHHKLQPAADLSRSKHTMTSVHWDQPPLPTHKTHNKLVHAGSQINVDTDDDGDNVTAKAHEQPPAVAAVGGGGVGKENKTTKMSSESVKGLTTEVDPHRSSSSSSDKASDYATGVDADAAADDNAAADDDDDDDDGIEYYDYVVDDESTAAEQHTLAAPDIGGFSYGGYDSGIDGIEPDWYASKKEHHQQQKQQQQIRHYQEQRQRRQYQHQHQHQPQHIQHQQQQQQRMNSEYQTEHSRVTRDHHRVQAVELQNNHLPYDTSSDDDVSRS